MQGSKCSGFNSRTEKRQTRKSRKIQDTSSIPGWVTKISHAMGQLSPHTMTREKPAPCNKSSHRLQQTPNAAKSKQKIF